MTDQPSYVPPEAGEHHARLQPFAGTFLSKVTVWFGPDQVHESTGIMTSDWHVNGLFLNQDYVSDAADGSFPAFEGKGYWGYSTFENEYQGFWIDNASTHMQMETGKVDESGKVWTMLSEVPSPHDGGVMKKRTIITLIDNDHHKLEAFVETPGGEFKNMEINYTRK